MGVYLLLSLAAVLASSVIRETVAQPPAGGGKGGGGGGTSVSGYTAKIQNDAAACEPPIGTPQQITGYIYCDNYFEFYFNGELIKVDPITFTPHQAVRVSFTWDGVSPKNYAIMCMDFASPSGYEYTGTASAALGDGSLMAEFSDGTVTNKDWRVFVASHGPTDASISNGCSSSNLDACAVSIRAEPSLWQTNAAAGDGWSSATEYTAAEAGWGMTPEWDFDAQCCGSNTSPVDRATIGCGVNYNSTAESVVKLALGATSQQDCVNPQSVLSEERSKMIWSDDLERDNRLLFRHTVAAPTALPEGAVPCSVCAADESTQSVGSARTLRVRKDVVSLTAGEWRNYSEAVWTLKTTTLADGVAAFGAGFKKYDYLVAKNALAIYDVRGDQAHYGPQFMTWHSAFLLEFENAVLAVNPAISGLPYWNPTSDAADPNASIFTGKYVGSAPGSGENSKVEDGVFSSFPVESDFDLSKYTDPSSSSGAPVNSPYKGAIGGSLRASDSSLGDKFVVRFGSPWTYDANDYWKCANLDAYWLDWYKCIELGSFSTGTLVTGSLHGGPHPSVGGTSSAGGGDFEDPTTSPNDPIFWLHHANVDRSVQWWMHANRDKRWSRYGYPAKNAAAIGGPGGTSSYVGQNSGDPMSSGWGFTAAQLGFPPNASVSPTALLTNADVLCWNQPNMIYTYDTFLKCAGPNASSDGRDGMLCRPDWSQSTVSTTEAWIIVVIVVSVVIVAAVVVTLVLKKKQKCCFRPKTKQQPGTAGNNFSSPSDSESVTTATVEMVEGGGQPALPEAAATPVGMTPAVPGSASPQAIIKVGQVVPLDP
jgi:tyrosinase